MTLNFNSIKLSLDVYLSSYCFILCHLFCLYINSLKLLIFQSKIRILCFNASSLGFIVF